MTATPTPLRELIALWLGAADRIDMRHSPNAAELTERDVFQLCASQLQAALSARDAAGADGWGPSYQQPWQAQAEATPPAASGEDWQAKQTAEWLDERAEEQPRESIAVMYRDAAKLIRRLAAVAPAGMDGWQPIETAPKDGTEVLLLVKRRAGIPGCQLVGHYMPGGHCIEDHPPIAAGWYFWNGCMFDVAAEPTAWRPLPTPPATAGKE